MQAVVVRQESALAAASRKIDPYAFSQRCTGSVRLAILHARGEAVHRGETLITPCDLLAGLCEEEDTRAERIGKLKSNAGYLRWLLRLPQKPLTESPAPGNQSSCELDPQARRALVYAVAEADRDDEHWIDSDHLLRGLMRFSNRAQTALFNTELTLRAARASSFHDRDQYEPEEKPDATMMETLVGKHIPYLAPRLLAVACYVYIFMDIFGALLQPCLLR